MRRRSGCFAIAWRKQDGEHNYLKGCSRLLETTALAQGYLTRCGQIIDASLVQAPVQRNKREADLKQACWRAHIQRKGTARKPISATQKQRNRRIATPRARVEHVFGALAQMGGKLVLCMGIVRATFALNLKAASYNLKRLVFLKEQSRAAC